MKSITISNGAIIPIPDNHEWSVNPETNILGISNSEKKTILEIRLLNSLIPSLKDGDKRKKWCHDWMIDYLRDEVGPPYQSNLAEIENATWVGWQAFTSLGEGMFLGNRCIIAIKFDCALHLSFKMMRKQIDPIVAEIAEGVVFSERVSPGSAPES